MVNHLAAAPPGFALELARLLDDLGIDRAHVAGNSVGGWTALELGKLGRAQSVVALGPPGLWRHGSPRATLQLIAMHLGARAGRPAAVAAVRTRLGRRLLLGTTVGEPDRLPPAAAAHTIEDLAGAAGFIPTVVDTHFRPFAGGHTRRWWRGSCSARPRPRERRASKEGWTDRAAETWAELGLT
jgi:pimeloyl-ACP methyl ester carboxylesterase